MNKIALRACPICENREVELLQQQKFVLPEGNILPDAFDVVWCPVCSFAFADTPAGQEVYGRYYAAFSKYEDNETSTGGGGSEWDARRLRETAAAIARAMPERASRILDLGCANGGLLGELKNLGYTDLLAVDPSPACVANARRLYHLEAKTGSIREMPSDIGQFDLVILSHVLEHVVDLPATVRDLVPLLREGGRFYVEVPDASRYHEFLLAPFQDFNTEHINHFSLAALRNLFARHGFEVDSRGQKTIESSPDCPYPAAFSFFRRSAATEEVTDEVDPSFHANLLAYIQASRQKLDDIENTLAPLAAAEGSLLVWGVGQLTMKLLAETSLGEMPIAAFIDANPIHHGKRLRGLPILAPRELRDRTTPILLATLLHQKDITEIIRDQLKLPNPIIALGG